MCDTGHPVIGLNLLSDVVINFLYKKLGMNKKERGENI